jgi:hypothetical protein
VIPQNSLIDGRKFLPEQEFKIYSPFAYDKLGKQGNHFLLPNIHTRERKDNKVSGFIKSLGSDHILMFTIENDFINYDGLIFDYNLYLSNLHQEVNLDDLSDDEFASDAGSE